MNHVLLAALVLTAAAHAQAAAPLAAGAAIKIPPQPRVAEIAKRDHGQTGVSFRTSDSGMQTLFDAAEAKEAENIYEISPGVKVLVEGGGFAAVYLETQAMGGEMYAKRNPQVALNNQLIFMLCQRSDGRFPGCVRSVERARKGYFKDGKWLEYFTELPELGLVTEEREIQGYCFPTPAWKMYFWTGKDRQYLELLYSALESFDAYLWKTRDSNGNGLLETWCTWDTGDDGDPRLTTRGAPTHWSFDQPPGTLGLPSPQDPAAYAYYWSERKQQKLPPPTPAELLVPIDSININSYSYDGRRTLARISRELGNGREAFWRQKADEVRQRVIAKLWRPDKHACYDRDRSGAWVDALVGSNYWAGMYSGMFTQPMADEFVRYHLLNPDEFLTPFGLANYSISEPSYQKFQSTNACCGLGQQRAIRALENYGHYAEVSLIGERLIKVLARNGGTFDWGVGVIDGKPTTACPSGNYGPLILAALEYTAHLHGIHIDEDRVWFSGLRPGGHDFTYTQRWNDKKYQLTCDHGQLRGSLNGRELFTCTAGVRVVTDVDGKILELVGINAEPQQVTLSAGGSQWQLTLRPNQVYGLDAPVPRLLRSAPFNNP
ncbi:MAG: hypothetical protein WCJ14_05040 [Verrucomicrobiota bacterium]